VKKRSDKTTGYARKIVTGKRGKRPAAGISLTKLTETPGWQWEFLETKEASPKVWKSGVGEGRPTHSSNLKKKPHRRSRGLSKKEDTKKGIGK